MVEWFTATDAYEVIWTFYLVDPDDPILENKAALTDTAKNTVYIGNCGNLNRILILAFHEILHINWSPPGGTPVLQSIFRTKTEERTDEVEELLVSYQSPILFAFLEKNDFLNLPEVPGKSTKK